MMKLIRASSILRVSFFSTKTSISRSSHSLQKIVLAITDPKTSIVPELEKWIEEGNTVEKEKLQTLIQRARNYRRPNHALEISQWMSDRRYFTLTESDIAIRLSLIFEVHGLECAEKYFSSVPNQLKSVYPYGAMLQCYVKEKSLEKAEGLMREMEEMDLVKEAFAYNMLVNLYAQTGQYSKIGAMMDDMERKGIPQDKFTLNNRLSASASASDIEGMEKVLSQMEEDPDIFVDWNSYVIAGNGYLKVGLTDKALPMLKKIEELITSRRTKIGFEYLLTLYASAGQKDDVYRIWKLMKSRGNLRSASYSCIIESLSRLNDIEGAEKILSEWESSCTGYDFRVLNRLVAAYCQKGLLEKAESVVRKAVEKVAERGRIPYASTWNLLALGFVKNKQMAKAVEMSKNSMQVGRRGWKPKLAIVTSCMDYFEAQKDVEGAIDFCRLFEKSGVLTREVYHSLLRTHIAANRPVLDILDLMESAGFSADEETQKILEKMPEQQVIEPLCSNWTVLQDRCYNGRNAKEGNPFRQGHYEQPLNACAAKSDIEGMMNVLKQMEEDPDTFLDWSAYSIAANAYLRGVPEKAESVVRKAVEKITESGNAPYARNGIS
ncbi:hypothetical protein Sjap_000218 [Stephania japonica]|uniref:Pentatricopeptide repeat-containing protein n=1 Tax=Stephania japonica TaxID=461633 RepID=A0AAP0PQ71_9MAGN